ncbi:hypothetical protein CEXT_239781 [Caerostris extrusa]|uniref:Uncharacterized protein n=1 Tax=Caerostris extrusa TaxID=172846 RepID=A0AAV4S0E9_CAEEX|nr:hypothetical protein CEXT_239781 [Caerostris extrusa]
MCSTITRKYYMPINTQPLNIIRSFSKERKIRSKMLIPIPDSAYTRKLKLLPPNFLLLRLFFLSQHSAFRERSGALFLIGCFPSERCKKQKRNGDMTDGDVVPRLWFACLFSAFCPTG